MKVLPSQEVLSSVELVSKLISYFHRQTHRRVEINSCFIGHTNPGY